MQPDKLKTLLSDIDWGKALGLPGGIHIPYSPELLKRLLIILAAFIVAWVIWAALLKLIRLFHDLREPRVFLEITPPQVTEVSATTTSELFSLIAGVMQQRSLLDRLLLRQAAYSFEIVSQKEAGVKYLLLIPRSIASLLEKSLRAYVPGLSVKETSEYIPAILPQNTRITEYKLTSHFALSLNAQENLKEHDPLAYLTSSMTQLKKDELMAVQVVVRPIHGLHQRGARREIDRIKGLMRHNRFSDWSRNLGGQKGINMMTSMVDGITRIITTPILFVTDFFTGAPPLPKEQKATQKVVTAAEQELEELVKAKLSQTLFEVSVRTLVIAEKDHLLLRERGFRSSFTSFGHANGQAIIPRITGFKKMRFWQIKKRLSGTPLFLTSSEVGALYHFSHSASSQTEDLVRVRSRELPAPLSMKKVTPEFDITVGMNRFGGEDVPIGIPLEQRRKHLYVIGKTGMGKTTLLTSAIYQDMVNGKGLAVLDPHGDMLQELLRIIPENRRKDVILFDPSDREWPIGINLLAPRIDFASPEDAEEWITSSVLAVFAKLTDKQYWGPRMEHILRNTTLTALQVPNASLFTLQRLLTDKVYQKQVAAKLKDPVLRQFWEKEFALLGTMQLSSVIAPLTQRLGHFITTKMSRHILLQEKSTISISEIMDKGKILLVNLSKGDIGEDQSFFFGTVLTSFIWMAAYQRTKVPEHKRRDFFLYVDEFQNFAAPRFSEIVSEGRKFRVSLIASHQNIAQVEDRNILKVIAGNAGSIICLKASPEDEAFILPHMEPEVEKGDIVNLAPYRFFMKSTSDVSESAFSGHTVPLDVERIDEIRDEVIANSRMHYATPRIQVEGYLEELFAGKPVEAVAKPKKATKKATKELPIAVDRPQKLGV